MRMSFVRFAAFLMALILCLSVVATALAYNTIPYGEESQDVRDMQSKLKSKGYYKGKVDGKFGPETRRAVRKFQEAIGITVDGKNKENAINFLKIFSSMGVQEGLTALKNPSPLVGGPATQELDQIENIVNNATSISGNYGDLQQYGDWFVNVLGPLSTQLINGAITPEAFITQLDTDTAAFYQ